MTEKIDTPDSAFTAPSPEPEKAKEPVKKTIESHFRSYLQNQSDLAVFEDSDGLVRLTMEWKNGHWRRIQQNRRTDRAEKFCAGFESLYRDGAVESCSNLMTPALYNLKKTLIEHPNRHLIATPNRMLEVTPEGIRVANLDKRIFIRVFAPVKIDEDRVRLDMGAGGTGAPYFYQLRSTQELEKDTKFGKLVRSLFPDDHTRRVLQQFMGTLFTRLENQTVAVIQGEGGTGKSVLVKLMAMLIGNSQALNLSRASPYQIAAIHLAPVIVIDEIRGRVDTTLFKQLTGRSIMQGEHKYEAPFSFVYDGGLLLSWNEPPRMDDHSSAIEQRMVVFQVAGEVKRGTSKEIMKYEKVIFDEEADVVLEWCLQGALEVVKRGRLPTGKELGERLLRDKESLGRDSDPLRGFVEEFDVRPSGGHVVYDKDDVYELLKKWLSKEGRMPGAPMVKSVALRHLKRILEQMYGQGCLGGELKVPSLNRRVPAMRISFGFQVPIKPLRSTDVIKAELDETCVDELSDDARKYLNQVNAVEALSKQEAEEANERRMRGTGFVEGNVFNVKIWSKPIDLDIDPSPSPF